MTKKTTSLFIVFWNYNFVLFFLANQSTQFISHVFLVNFSKSVVSFNVSFCNKCRNENCMHSCSIHKMQTIHLIQQQILIHHSYLKFWGLYMKRCWKILSSTNFLKLWPNEQTLKLFRMPLWLNQEIFSTFLFFFFCLFLFCMWPASSSLFIIIQVVWSLAFFRYTLAKHFDAKNKDKDVWQFHFLYEKFSL